MNARFLLPRIIGRRGGGRCYLDQEVLRLNLSFVLHERADSEAVRQVADSCERHAGRVPNLPQSIGSPATVDGTLRDPVDRWLTASVGLPATHLATALQTAYADISPLPGGPSGIHLVDAVVPLDDGSPCVSFFRAPSRIILLDDSEIMRVGVVGLVLRPDGKTSHLRLFGTYRWPEDRDAVIRSLEHLVQAYADQWFVKIPLWDAPAEVLLGDEIE